MFNFTLLKMGQIFDNVLEVLDKYDIYYGRKAAATDLGVLLGAYVSKQEYDQHTVEGDFPCLSCQISDDFGDVNIVDTQGLRSFSNRNARNLAFRPALPPSEASRIKPNKEKTILKRVKVYEYGEYPQTIADEKTNAELENLFQSNSLSKTGKHYTFDETAVTDENSGFKEKPYTEYVSPDGKKYIRMLGRQGDAYSRLSDGKIIEKDKPYWVHVEPIEWLADKSGWLISKKCLFSNIRYDDSKDFINNYFAKEIEPGGDMLHRLKSYEQGNSSPKGLFSQKNEGR